MVHAQRVVTASRAVVLPVAILLAAVLLLTGCRKEEKEVRRQVVRPVKVMTVRSSASTLTISFPGTVRAARRAVLSFKVSGPLVKLPVEEGQHVKKGDLIAQIQKRDFQTALEEARARALEAERQFSRYKELYARKQVSRADYDRYRAARDVARARLEDARNQLRDTSLLAPFDGVISKRYVENFQKVQAKEPIANLQDITRIEILVDVPEQVMAEIRDKEETLEIFATFDSIPGKKFPLEVKEYSTQADPATQTYQVVLVMDQPGEANILPGMTALVTARATRAAGAGEQVITIPAIAVMDAAGDRPFVWIFDPKTGTVHRRFVTIGRITGSSDIVIREGLKGGETIVIAGLTQLEEGMKVRPWEKQRERK
ncbi:MAG TPA: efflux RND transporter periplasmic adaptor subunit [Desulfobulbus sp.]|nr:efflux RND transporter periplasmic adaptor subunit [Desulfobulbus sp.]